MDWTDEGIILSTRSHGETDAIAEVLTRGHGRHLGLVRGGRSRRQRPALQSGNVVNAHWRARLAEHLGNYTLEMIEARAALALYDATALAGLSTLCALAHLLPEREPHNALHDTARLVLDHIGEPDIWPGLLVRWEMGLLEELGFRLDLSTCAKTGGTQDLIYVSPKSGRAVSREAGAPYTARLLALPDFLKPNGGTELASQDLLAGFALTGYFLELNVFRPRGLTMPEARGRLLLRLDREINSP